MQPPCRKLEQIHRSFMDEKDRIITAIYNDTRARARSVPALSCLLFTVLTSPSRILCPDHPGALSRRANRAKLQERVQRQQLQPRPGGPEIPEIVPPGTGPGPGPGAAR